MHEIFKIKQQILTNTDNLFKITIQFRILSINNVVNL